MRFGMSSWRRSIGFHLRRTFPESWELLPAVIVGKAYGF